MREEVFREQIMIPNPFLHNNCNLQATEMLFYSQPRSKQFSLNKSFEIL